MQQVICPLRQKDTTSQMMLAMEKKRSNSKEQENPDVLVGSAMEIYHISRSYPFTESNCIQYYNMFIGKSFLILGLSNISYPNLFPVSKQVVWMM